MALVLAFGIVLLISVSRSGVAARTVLSAASLFLATAANQDTGFGVVAVELVAGLALGVALPAIVTVAWRLRLLAALFWPLLAVSAVVKKQSLVDRIALPPFLSSLLWLIGVVGTSRAELYERGVLVTNWLTRFWIPWGAVAGVGSDPRLSLVLVDGREVGLAVGAGSLLNHLFGNRYQRNLGSQLQEVRAKAPTAGPSPDVVKEVRLGLARFFGWLGSFAFFLVLCLLWWALV
ncbi:hypothetical protein [Streptoalloteichus hindustanus]|uniref:Uncharacterized protein n=1 Tax=Streptoalloteichus hindustanus TaxID=2017 RepID=A0A1M5IF29_STRHI|nr:hypothetical protein [Streptoalloteichus hindustanus]SHG26856.1 hypothetical protein SAMN05444320_107254 [Streptoalloteichus hindustanus]